MDDLRFFSFIGRKFSGTKDFGDGKILFVKAVSYKKCESDVTRMNKQCISALLATALLLGNAPVASASPRYREESYHSIAEAAVAMNDMTSGVFKLPTDKRYPAYEDAFRVTGIASYTNNGGRYQSSVIENAFDGDPNTHWETGRPNSATFTNEVVVTFEQVEEINRVVYKARRDAGNKGFATKVAIYSSLEETGDDFRLVGRTEAAKHGGFTEFKFESTQFKRLKFVFEEAFDNWASASELQFFREDVLGDTIGSVFTNGLQTELAQDYQSLDAVEQLERLAAAHPFKEDYLSIAQAAKQLYFNPDLYRDAYVITASQRGHESSEASQHNIPRAVISMDSFGRYVVPNETISVYVDADPNGVMPTLGFGQIADDKNGWRREYSLKPGKNVITAPGPDNMNPAAVYVINKALPEQQAYAPRVRMEGGTAFPIYRHGETSPEQFKQDLIAYCENISINNEDFYHGVPEGKFYNIAELTSENNTISTSAFGALKGITEMKGKYTVADTMDYYEEVWHHFQTISGYSAEAEDPRDQLFTGKFNTRIFCQGPFGFSDWGYVGFNGGKAPKRDTGLFKGIVQPVAFTGGDWGYLHEWGHNLNTARIEHGEVTNNIYAMEIQRMMGTRHTNYPDYNTIYKTFSGETYSHGYFTNLAVLMQIQDTYGNDTYGKAQSIARRNPDGVLNGLRNNLERMAVCMSLAADTDLMDFFETHHYVQVTPFMREKVAHLQKPTVKVEYMHGKAYGYQGQGFTEAVQPEILTIVSDTTVNTNKLVFGIDEANREHHMGYEIFRDGALIGYTVGDSFVDKNIDPNQNYLYEMVAYDKKLGTAAKVQRYSAMPTLLAEAGVTIALHDSFEPLDYVRALDSLNNDLTGTVKVLESNVDVSRKGTYAVKFEVENQGIAVQAVMPVTVVSDLVYVSDVEWSSSHAGYGRIEKDLGQGRKPLKTFELVGTKTYAKGVGMHAISELTIDLTGKDFDTFSTYVSADGNDTSDRTSVHFEVYVDGALAAKSDVLRVGTPKQYISVHVKDASELHLVMSDGGNGISNDRGVWADAKFTKGNCKPTLAFEATSASVKLGEAFDLKAGLTATDIEDGNLLDQVVVRENGFDTNKTGVYKVDYVVTDSDGNETTLTREIVVYSSAAYLGDMDWKNASIEYGRIGKNGNINGQPIKLLVDGEVKTFEKGIGTHAKSEIVYDLRGKEYTHLETYVGVDRNVREQDASSVTFTIQADGITVFESGLMKWYTPAKFARVPLAGVSELKLIVGDGGNGIGVDHASFGGTKLLVTNSVPTLEVPKDEAVKIGEVLSDVFGAYRAIDPEDGDITAKVSVSGTVDYDKTGKYPISYQVTDSDGNTVTAQRVISVVDMRDFTYVSDADWVSANCSWGTVKKDLAPGGNTIRLTDEAGKEVRFEKGLGTHAVSTLVYDLTQMDAAYFSSYVGVDRGMYGSVGSVGFEVWLDGEKVAETQTINSRDPMQYIEVDLAGAKELKLVANDGHNGNGSDHAAWGDTKFHFANPDRANKKELAALVTESEKLVQEEYTQDSWAAFATVLEQAKALLAQEHPTQQDVDEMVLALTEATKQLVPFGDKTALLAVLTQLKELDLSKYTKHSVETIKGAVVKGEEAMQTAMTQKDVDALTEQLRVVYGGAELSEHKVRLGQAVTAAYDPKYDDYQNVEMWGEYELTRSHYKAVYEGETVHTELQLDLMVGFMEQYMEMLERQGANLSDLKTALAQLKGLDLSKYTKHSVETVKAAVARAEEAMQTAMTQKDVDALTEQLREVHSGAERSAQKVRLGQAVTAAYDPKYDDYQSAEMWSEYDYIRSYYKEVYEGETAHTEMELEIMVGFMEQYIEMLERSGS